MGNRNADRTIADFLRGKSPKTVALFNFFVEQYQDIGSVTFIPAKTMIGVATARKRIAYVTQLGKNFVHVVFHFDQPYYDNLLFSEDRPGAGRTAVQSPLQDV